MVTRIATPTRVQKMRNRANRNPLGTMSASGMRMGTNNYYKRQNAKMTSTLGNGYYYDRRGKTPLRKSK